MSCSSCDNYRRNYNDNFMNNEIVNNNINSNFNRCSCNMQAQTFPDNYLYGYAYTPVQTMNETYNPNVGLQNGTIFPELVSPYYPGQSMDFINYLRNGGNLNG